MFEDIPTLLPDLRELYEDLHRHPELSFAEVRTAGIMAQRLADLGYEVSTGVGRTGVVATLDNGDDHTVLLRADIDALPVKEATGLPYASTATGIDADGTEVPVAGIFPRVMGTVCDIMCVVHRTVRHATGHVSDAMTDAAHDITGTVHHSAEMTSSGLTHLADSTH